MIKYYNDTNNDKIAIIEIEDFTLDAAMRFMRDLTEAQHNMVDVAYVVVCSDGGDTRALYAMLDAIESYDGTLAVCGMGTCCSSAADLLFSVSTHYRYAGLSTEFLIHESVVTTENNRRSAMVRRGTKTRRFLQSHKRRRQEKRLKELTDAKLISMISENSDVSEDFIRDKIAQNDGEWVFSAIEALEYGFIDFIGVPFLNGGAKDDTE